MMHILLTGATGYIGAHILLELTHAGHHVTAFVRDSARLGPTKPGRTVVGDLTDLEQVSAATEGQDAVVHAGLIWAEPGSEFRAPDTAAAATLFEAAGNAGVKTCILLSSTAVHRPFSPRMSEKDPITTSDIYGATKAAAELMMWAACHTHGMDGVVLRCGPVVGPPAYPGGPFRSPRQIENLVKDALAGNNLEVQPGAGRQLVGVQDVARIVENMLDEPKASTYLCVAAEYTTWASIAEGLVRATRSGSKVVTVGDEAPLQHFDTSKLTALAGPLSVQSALHSHIEHVLHSTQNLSSSV